MKNQLRSCYQLAARSVRQPAAQAMLRTRAKAVEQEGTGSPMPRRPEPSWIEAHRMLEAGDFSGYAAMAPGLPEGPEKVWLQILCDLMEYTRGSYFNREIRNGLRIRVADAMSKNPGDPRLDALADLLMEVDG